LPITPAPQPLDHGGEFVVEKSDRARAQRDFFQASNVSAGYERISFIVQDKVVFE
jgi:hypothetical protein